MTPALLEGNPIYRVAPPSPDEEDFRLIQSVLGSVNKKYGPEKTVKVVRKQVLVDSNNPKQKLAFSYLNLQPDPQMKMGDMPELWKCKAFLIWLRPVESKIPKVVGVYWTDKMECRVFYGVLLPR
jgi:hypothetical protein